MNLRRVNVSASLYEENRERVLPRLWGKIEVRADGCWIALSKARKAGVPSVFVGVSEGSSYMVPIARILWRELDGAWPPFSIKRTCTSEDCVNPHHYAERDSTTRRSPERERVARRIREEYRRGATLRFLAEKYGMPHQTVHDIVRGRLYADEDDA